MSDALPYDINALTGAAARVMLAPYTETIPDNPVDIFDQVSPYVVNGTWFNVGATSGPVQTGRNLAVAGYTIEQSQTVLLEEPTEVTYTLQVPIAELSPEMLKIINDSAADVDAVAAITGAGASGAGSKTHFGNIFDLTHYRVAFVVRRSKSQGLVTEPGGRTRGRFFTFVGYDATITAENVQSSFGKGQLASATITFKLYPDSTVTEEGAEHGFYFDENAGTLVGA